MEGMTIEFGLNVILLAFLVITALAVVTVRNLLTSTILLGIFSLLMAAQYLALGAADVAITEAAVGAGISTILLLLALFRVGDKEKQSKGNRFVSFVVVSFVAVTLMYVTIDMPPFGHPDTPSQTHVVPYYLANAQEQTGIPNMVTSILASYRGYDTLGETAVIFTAILAVLLLLGKLNRRSGS